MVFTGSSGFLHHIQLSSPTFYSPSMYSPDPLHKDSAGRVKCCQWLAVRQSFLPGPPVSSTTYNCLARPVKTHICTPLSRNIRTVPATWECCQWLGVRRCFSQGPPVSSITQLSSPTFYSPSMHSPDPLHKDSAGRSHCVWPRNPYRSQFLWCLVANNWLFSPRVPKVNP